MEIGSKRKQCDWQLEGRPEGIGLLVPDVQFYRRMASVIAVRARLQIAGGNYEAACETLQIGYAHAYHLCRGPTFIHVFVGLANARLLTVQLRNADAAAGRAEFILESHAHAKTVRRFAAGLAGRKAVHGEHVSRSVKKLDAVPMSEEQVKAFEEIKIKQMIKEFNVPEAQCGAAPLLKL